MFSQFSFSILINNVALICTLSLRLSKEPPWILRYCVGWLLWLQCFVIFIFTLWLKVQIKFKQTQSLVELPGTFPLWKGQELQKKSPRPPRPNLLCLKRCSAWFKVRQERSTQISCWHGGWRDMQVRLSRGVCGSMGWIWVTLMWISLHLLHLFSEFAPLCTCYILY